MPTDILVRVKGESDGYLSFCGRQIKTVMEAREGLFGPFGIGVCHAKAYPF